MLKIRLARHGKRNDPHYRIVCIQDYKKNKGEPLAVLGYWHPKSGLKKIDKNLIEEWTKKGAQKSAAVKKLLN